jgi:hypothetical protein
VSPSGPRSLAGGLKGRISASEREADMHDARFGGLIQRDSGHAVDTGGWSTEHSADVNLNECA